MREGLILIISAPSGTGKTSLASIALKQVKGLKRSMSFTTRPPRPGELHGTDYYFVSKDLFEMKIKNGEFIEWANVHGYMYGTPIEPLKKRIEDGEDVLLVIDVQGAREIKRKFPKAISIFIFPPSYQVLKERLMDRKANNGADIELRLRTVKQEIEEAKIYDYIIVNDILDEAVENLKAIIIAERCRPYRLVIGG